MASDANKRSLRRRRIAPSVRPCDTFGQFRSQFELCAAERERRSAEGASSRRRKRKEHIESDADSIRRVWPCSHASEANFIKLPPISYRIGILRQYLKCEVGRKVHQSINRLIDKAEMHKMLTELQFCKREVIVATNSKKKSYKYVDRGREGERGKGDRTDDRPPPRPP